VSTSSKGRQQQRWLWVALGVVVLFAAPLWLPAAVAFSGGTAWGVALAAVMAVLWLGTSGWRAWPLEDRRGAAVSVAVGLGFAIPLAILAVGLAVALVLAVVAPGSGLVPFAWRVFAVDPGVWFLVVVATVPLTYALRTVTPRAADLWLERRGLPSGLPPAATREVRRLRVWRTVPAVLGACIALATGSAYNLALDLLGSADPASRALLDVATSASPGVFVLAGYLLGVVLAEVTRRRPAGTDGARVAGFVARRPAGYLTPVARAVPLAVAALLLLATATAVAVGGGLDTLDVAPTTVVLTVLVLAAGIPALHSLVVRRPHHGQDPAALALDVTLRSSAAHAMVGAGAATGLFLAAGVLGSLWNASLERGGGAVMWLLALVGIGLSVAAVTVWLGYGSAHRGARPTVDVP
jgi:hypothetical protein